MKKKYLLKRILSVALAMSVISTSYIPVLAEETPQSSVSEDKETSLDDMDGDFTIKDGVVVQEKGTTEESKNDVDVKESESKDVQKEDIKEDAEKGKDSTEAEEVPVETEADKDKNEEAPAEESKDIVEEVDIDTLVITAQGQIVSKEPIYTVLSDMVSSNHYLEILDKVYSDLEGLVKDASTEDLYRSALLLKYQLYNDIVASFNNKSIKTIDDIKYIQRSLDLYYSISKGYLVKEKPSKESVNEMGKEVFKLLSKGTKDEKVVDIITYESYLKGLSGYDIATYLSNMSDIFTSAKVSSAQVAYIKMRDFLYNSFSVVDEGSLSLDKIVNAYNIVNDKTGYYKTIKLEKGKEDSLNAELAKLGKIEVVLLDGTKLELDCSWVKTEIENEYSIKLPEGYILSDELVGSKDLPKIKVEVLEEQKKETDEEKIVIDPKEEDSKKEEVKSEDEKSTSKAEKDKETEEDKEKAVLDTVFEEKKVDTVEEIGVAEIGSISSDSTVTSTEFSGGNKLQYRSLLRSLFSEEEEIDPFELHVSADIKGDYKPQVEVWTETQREDAKEKKVPLLSGLFGEEEKEEDKSENPTFEMNAVTDSEHTVDIPYSETDIYDSTDGILHYKIKLLNDSGKVVAESTEQTAQALGGYADGYYCGYDTKNLPESFRVPDDKAPKFLFRSANALGAANITKVSVFEAKGAVGIGTVLWVTSKFIAYDGAFVDLGSQYSDHPNIRMDGANTMIDCRGSNSFVIDKNNRSNGGISVDSGTCTVNGLSLWTEGGAAYRAVNGFWANAGSTLNMSNSTLDCNLVHDMGIAGNASISNSTFVQAREGINALINYNNSYINITNCKFGVYVSNGAWKNDKPLVDYGINFGSTDGKTHPCNLTLSGTNYFRNIGNVAIVAGAGGTIQNWSDTILDIRNSANGIILSNMKKSLFYNVTMVGKGKSTGVGYKQSYMKDGTLVSVNIQNFKYGTQYSQGSVASHKVLNANADKATYIHRNGYGTVVERGCNLTNFGSCGLCYNDYDGAYVEGTFTNKGSIYSNGRHGIWIGGKGDASVANQGTVFSNTNRGIELVTGYFANSGEIYSNEYGIVQSAGTSTLSGNIYRNTKWGAVINGGSSTVTGYIQENKSGGGISASTGCSGLTLSGATIRNNTGHGVSSSATTTNISTSTVSGNTSNGIVLFKKAILTGNTVSSNGSVGLYIDSNPAVVTLKSGSIFSNYRGVHVYSGVLTMESGTVSDNNAGVNSGGGVHVAELGVFNLQSGTIENNKAKYGGGIDCAGYLNITGGIIRNNTADYGGAVFNKYQTNIKGGTITGNKATVVGGGVYQSAQSLSISNGDIYSNTSPAGSGIYAATNQVVKLSANAYVRNQDEIYLADGAYINITTALTKGVKAANIRVSNPSNGRLLAVVPENKKASTEYKYSTGTQKFGLLNAGYVIRPADYLDASAKINSRYLVMSSKYSITYDKNTTDTVNYLPSNTEKYWNESITIPSKAPSRGIIPFRGYSTTASNRKGEYAAGAKISANSNLKLYAIWETQVNVKYTSAYKTSGTDKSEIVNYADIATAGYKLKNNSGYTNFKRTGYEFVGWNLGDGDTWKSGYPEGKKLTYEDLYRIAEQQKTIADVPIVTLHDSWDKHPELKAKQVQEFYEGETVTQKMLLDNVTANDREDGNITSKIKITKIQYANGKLVDGKKQTGLVETWSNMPNNYIMDTWFMQMDKADSPIINKVTYEVTDSFGSKTTLVQDVIVKYNEFPEIQSRDRYFSLDEAKAGVITKNEIMSTATASDKEDGIITSKLELLGYNADEFKNFNESGFVVVTYKVIDRFGKETVQQSTIYVERMGEKIPPRKTKAVRFIDKKNYDKNKNLNLNGMSGTQKAELNKNGGLNVESKWYLDSNYKTVIESALSNSSPVQTWVFSHSDVQNVKEYIDANGIGTTGSSTALDGFLSKFGSLKK